MDALGYSYAVPGRSGTTYAAWLQQQTSEVIAGIETLNPFRDYANAVRDAAASSTSATGNWPSSTPTLTRG